MRKSIQISIPKPCHENWDSFTKTANGGFCQSCRKEVVDFTSWSDERIKAYFTKPTNNSCGRFRPDQLRVHSYDDSRRSGIGYLSFLIAGLLLLSSPRQASAQRSSRQTTEQYQPNLKVEGRQRNLPDKVSVFGTITSRDDGKVIPGVKVKLLGSSIETSTDENGKFTLALSYTDSLQLLEFSHKGYQPFSYVHNTTRPGREIEVSMKRDDFVQVQELLTGTVGCFTVGIRVEPEGMSARDFWWWLTGH